MPWQLRQLAQPVAAAALLTPPSAEGGDDLVAGLEQRQLGACGAAGFDGKADLGDFPVRPDIAHDQLDVLQRHPIADLGCGRGEFLEALRARGLTGIGCDTNPVMIARCREKGLAVDEADLFGWLRGRAVDSLGGVTAYQVVEHLPADALLPFVELAVSRLAPGGRLLLETVNAESVYAMKWFWMDLTHVRPVPAPSLGRLMEACGLRNVTIAYRSPVPREESGGGVEPSDSLVAALARLVFAPQDVAVTGVK